MVRFLRYAAYFAVVACTVAGVTFTRHLWLPLLRSPEAGPAKADEDTTAHSALPKEQVQLSPQAQKNLGLVSKPLRPTEYWKTIELPGLIVDRPGISDRGVVAPVTGVVTAIHHFAGDTVESGQPLFTLSLVGESFQTSQVELFKAVTDREIVQERIDRTNRLVQSGTVAVETLTQLKSEIRRLDATMSAYRQDLEIRGLKPAEIDAITRGTFVSKIVVEAPSQGSVEEEDTARSHSLSDGPLVPVFEVQELAVELGQQVQAGQRLCTLANHQSLFIEGRGFRQELPLLQQAAESSLPIHVELLEDSGSDWDTPIPSVVIHHISNRLDEKNRTISFFLTLENPYRTYERDGQSLFLWRFRPGQRVRLRLNVERLQNVFVLPAAAIVKEGPEAYVFRHNGNLFDRKPVHVLHQTQNEVVIANDGSVPPGLHVVQTGAVQMNRVLKSESGSAPSGVHVHADGTVHANH